VRTALGVRSSTRVPAVEGDQIELPDGSAKGLITEFLAADGTVLASEPRRFGSFNWMGDFGLGIDYSAVTAIRTRMTFTAAVAGSHGFGGSGVGHVLISLDGETVAETDVALPAGADLVEAMMTPPQLLVPRQLAAGESVAFEMTFAAEEMPGFGALWAFQVNIEAPHGTDDEELDAAVALAAESDAVVLVVGTTEEVESEGYDRTSLSLPGRQDELVTRVLAANPNTVVVVNSGAPVLMPWLADARAVLLAWFPGQQMGTALADVLTGAVEPGGRMPTSWPSPEAVVAPANLPVDGVVRYDEGLHIGYRAYLRAQLAPAVPFGHGLGYTSWELSEPAIAAGKVVLTVRNTGRRTGSQVIQVYLARPESTLERPLRWLAGFTKVRLAAGEAADVEVDLPERAFQHWDVAAGAWVTEPGDYTVAVGTSVADLPFALTITA
ncbi:MAG: glycoside hydrolase family 3 C-terminal domain-containing protein, partial [Propionicimonas sp.]